jgi:hypothetical protein
MSEPIVLISSQRIKKGKLDGYKQFSQKVTDLLTANKPGTVAFLPYLNEEETEATIVYVFRDAAAMESHLQFAAGVTKESSEYMDVVRLEVYGRPTDANLEAMKKIAGSGVALSVRPQSLGGYIRLKAG